MKLKTQRGPRERRLLSRPAQLRSHRRQGRRPVMQEAYRTDRADGSTPVAFDLVRTVQGPVRHSAECWGLPQLDVLTEQDLPPAVVRGYAAASDAALESQRQQIEREQRRRRLRRVLWGPPVEPRPPHERIVAWVIVLAVLLMFAVGLRPS